jgi:hypothetical protein
MYGNAPFGADADDEALTGEQRDALRRDITAIAARTRELLPGEYVVGAQIAEGAGGPRGRVAVQSPRGGMVTADYTPKGDVAISEEERDELVRGLAASAALEEMRAGDGNEPTPAA